MLNRLFYPIAWYIGTPGVRPDGLSRSDADYVVIGCETEKISRERIKAKANEMPARNTGHKTHTIKKHSNLRI